MNPPRDEADGGVSHDAWLREALRHAPDADALPPSALSDTILRQARAATMAARPAPTRSFGARVATAWAWLGRPPVAAGFASVMVAGVVGLMWWDRPIEEALPPRDVAAAAPAQAASAGPVAAATLPAPSPPAAIAAVPAATTAEPVRAAPRREPAPAVARPRADASPATTTAPMPETMAAAGAAAGPAPRAAEAAGRADADPPAAPAPAAAPVEREGRSAAAAADVRQAERSEQARSMATLSKAAPPAQRRVAAAPITSLRSAIAAQPERWHWRREAGEPRAVEPAVESWLGQLDSATASRWQDEPADAAAGLRAEAASLQLWLDGRLHGTLRLDAGGVGYEPAGAPGERQRAELPAAAAAALRAALDQATR